LLDAVVATVDVFTDRYELDLRRLAADLREAGVLTTTFQKTEAQLDRIVEDPKARVQRRLAIADILGRFGYMKRALLNFIEVGRRMSEALGTGRTNPIDGATGTLGGFR
jgi:hypothetical protein